MSRTILVTGGGTGIGRAVVRHFAHQGDTVFLTGRRLAPLTATADETGAKPLVCDHTDPSHLAALLAALPGRIDVLINNAGGNTDIGADQEPDGLDATAALTAYATRFRANLDANLVSAALTTYAVADRLAGGGAVVHIGSIAADQGAGSYGAAKAGLAAWNLDLAGELGARDITANVVSPGYIADTEFFRDVLTAERREQLVAATAVGRAGVPDDVAGAVAFLCSPAARHITGQVLNVNGGSHMTR
ncbi:SDR family NAD(P)-dependent oxidoreductase [Streptomyces zagrosensis]|uniref:3-oxoacyl-[acyl-carrier protein] reductase n=1 Tax=Streptomyces zagrosensis TaxID=1042984 RepID=A0A7W9Q4N8_9ACTN|nr:SDR family oxidoreductase [Streptomyces zagrosensis]MBB5933548.1 3-oxoacyl-[acyl-carrier protein] reductase [Streptomyces zagrosensis]